MKFSTSILPLALPVLVAAQNQFPLLDQLKGWFDKATANFQGSIPSVIPNPIDAGAAKVAEHVVLPIGMENWKDVLKPSPSAVGGPPEEWLVFFDGGNKTCYGLCGNATKAWNTAVALLRVAPHPPHLGKVDCDVEQVLCGMWAVGPPSIYHFLIPRPLPDQSKPATTARYIPLNRTSVTALEIAELHTKENYKNTAPYEGVFHPFDGLLEQTGVNVPLAYVMWGFSKMPSWLPMIVISFLSRSFIGRRATGQARGPGAPAPAPAAQ